MYAHAYYFKYYYNIEYSNLKVGYILYIFGEFRVEKIMCILENLQKIFYEWIVTKKFVVVKFESKS